MLVGEQTYLKLDAPSWWHGGDRGPCRAYD
jgi:hypothetical protein